MRHVVRPDFHFTAPVARLVHAALVALLLIAALVAPLALAGEGCTAAPVQVPLPQ